MDVCSKTRRLYEEDPYCREFEAKVIACEKAEDKYHIILDQTAFFPEGGGQAADCGTIGTLDVLDVIISEGVIVHKTSEPIEVGADVSCKLDWDLRFGRMQNHSGEHILSGVVHNTYGYNNVGFHMSKSEMTVDFDGVLTKSDIENIEMLANRAVCKNLAITVSYPDKQETEKINFRSKLDNIEDLRLVTIEDIDCCACCAPHVARTGEIGIIKVVDFTPNKGGTRLTVVAGSDALRDYAMLNDLNKRLMKTLSVSRELVSDASEKQVEIINSLRFENAELSKRLAWSELETYDVNGCVCAFSKSSGYDELRHCSNLLLNEGKKVCALFSTEDNSSYIYVISSAKRDIRDVVKNLNENFSGKGGGKPNYAQGKIVSDSQDLIVSFVEKILKEI